MTRNNININLLSRITFETMSVKLEIGDKLIKKKKKNFLPRFELRTNRDVQNLLVLKYGAVWTLNLWLVIMKVFAMSLNKSSYIKCPSTFF